MKTPETVLRFYHPIALSRSVTRAEPHTAALLGETYSLTRSPGGLVAATCASSRRSPRLLEAYGSIWVSDTRFPAAPSPPVDFRDEGFVHLGTSRAVFPAPLHVAFDNFSEDEHTPWVHTFLGWEEATAGHIHFEHSRHADRTEVYYRGIQRPHPLTPALLVRWGDHFHNRWVTRLDPIRTVYTLHWSSAEGARRPVTSRFAIYFVPLSDTSTALHVLAYARIDPAFRFLAPVVGAVVPRIGASEVADDQRFIHHVAATPFSFTGMRLGRFDAPLVHNRKLMREVYFGEGGSEGALGHEPVAP